MLRDAADRTLLIVPLDDRVLDLRHVQRLALLAPSDRSSGHGRTIMSQDHPQQKPRFQRNTPSTNGPPAGRDPATGRFVKGYSGGPGNPFAGQVMSIRAAALASVTAKDMVEIFSTAKARAKAGDMEAARFVSSYVLGKPEQKHTHTIPRPRDLPEQLEYLFQRFADRPHEHWPPKLLMVYREMHPEKFTKQIASAPAPRG